jgi:hypothetical protein
MTETRNAHWLIGGNLTGKKHKTKMAEDVKHVQIYNKEWVKKHISSLRIVMPVDMS